MSCSMSHTLKQAICFEMQQPQHPQGAASSQGKMRLHFRNLSSHRLLGIYAHMCELWLQTRPNTLGEMLFLGRSSSCRNSLRQLEHT